LIFGWLCLWVPSTRPALAHVDYGLALAQPQALLPVHSKTPMAPSKSQTGYDRSPMRANTQFGVPLTLLHEADGFVVTIELKSGELYQGTLEGSEDTMNCHLKDVTFTNSSGVDSHLDSVYIRGSSILFIVVPDMFANAPMFLDQNRKVRGHAQGYAGNLRDKGLASKVRARYY
jgi:small nuclear ribonucleoprotein D3